MRIVIPGTAVGLNSIALAEGGRSWSLSTVFGVLLEEVQVRYGPRDRTYSFVGLEFGGPNPMTWYPGGRRDVAIVLSENAATDADRSCFQLAHEVVHLLCPTGRSEAVAFEEGLATAFSDEMSAKHGWRFMTPTGPYTEPCRLVRKALAEKSDGILNLRATKPNFADWQPDDLEVEFGAALTASERDFLCSRFVS